MPKYDVYGTVTASVHLGVVEAKDHTEALKLGSKLAKEQQRNRFRATDLVDDLVLEDVSEVVLEGT